MENINVDLKICIENDFMQEEIIDRIVIDPEILFGKPTIRGTRIPVHLIIELLANGLTEEEILRQYPTLAKNDIKAALLYASKRIEDEETISF